MNKIFKALTLSLLLVASFTNLHAQKGEKHDPIERAKMETTDLADKLALDQATADKLGEINYAYAEKQMATKEVSKAQKEAGNKMDKKAKKKEKKAMRDAKSEEIKALLGEAKFKEYKKLMKQRHRGERKNRKAEKREMKEGIDN